jgi:hypothetical protein
MISVFKIPTGLQLFNRLIATAKLWLWASPLVVFAASVGFWRHRHNTHMKLLLASAVITFVAYLFVPLDQGHGWGYRYFHSVWFVLPVFAGAALATPRPSPLDRDSTSLKPLISCALAGTVGGLIIMTPYFAWSVHSFMSAHLALIPTADHGVPRVVIINPQGYHKADLVQNDPFLAGPVVRMLSQGPRDTEVMARRFPDLILLGESEEGSVWGERRDAVADPPR